VFSVEGCAFGLHEVGFAVFALVSLVLGGVVFALFCDVFVLFFLVVGAFGVLAYNINSVFWSFLRHVFHW
jgi:hypothetical protein